MKAKTFTDLMEILVRDQSVVSLRTNNDVEQHYFAVVPIGFGTLKGELFGAFVNIVERFETHADKNSIVYIPAFSIREMGLSFTSENYPMHWIKNVELAMENAFTLRTIFPDMFKLKKKSTSLASGESSAKSDGKVYSKSRKRILKP